MMNRNDRLKTQQSRYKSRWRGSINQFSKMDEQSQMVKVDTVYRNICSLKLKMKNRLGQIDEDWDPIVQRKNVNNSVNKFTQKHQNNRMASTAHDSNILTSFGSQQHKLQQSIILTSKYNIPPYTCHPIRQQLIQQLTEYNKQKYDQKMKQQCSKYSESFKSMLYSLVNNEKKQIDQFCYLCDQVVKKDTKQREHKCKVVLDSISRVNQALQSLKSSINHQNNKIFNIFFHNALQPAINIDELISNLTVLKQSIHHNYDPEQVLLRLRLMNLMGKKIGLLIEEKDLQRRLVSVCRSSKK